VAIFCALTTIPSYLIVKETTNNEVGGIAASIATVISPQLVRMSSDLMKNASGVFFLTLSIYLLTRLTIKKDLKTIPLLIISSYLAFLTHSLDFAYTLLYIIVYSIAHIIFTSHKKSTIIVWAITILTISTLIIASALAFPYYFTDINKGIIFIRDIISPKEGKTARHQLPLGKPKPSRTWPTINYRDIGYSIPYLLAGVILLIDVHRREKEKIDTLIPLIIATIIACLVGMLPSLLNLKEWAWRFLLMELVPIGIITGIATTRPRDKISSLVILTILITPIIIQTGDAVLRVAPTTTLEGYNDLLKIREIMNNNKYHARCRADKYWFEYVLGPEEEGPVDYIIICKGIPPPPNVFKPIFHGKYYTLFKRSISP